jgi:drug/metabolite transporter (DMT)-like permease
MLDLRLILVALFWGINFSAVKFALRDFGPMGFTVLRFSSAAVVLFIAARLMREPIMIAPPDRGPVVKLGLIGIALYNVLCMYGLRLTTAAHAALFISLSPLFGALIRYASDRERPGIRTAAGFLIAFAGALLIITSGTEHTGVPAEAPRRIGDLLMLGASFAWALYTVTAGPVLAKYPPGTVTAWSMVAGSAMLLPPALIEAGGQDWSAVSPASWAALIFASVFGGGIAYSLWYGGVKRIGATRTIIYHYLMPFVAVLFAAIALGEIITGLQLAGGGFILSGLWLVQGPDKRNRKHSAQ